MLISFGRGKDRTKRKKKAIYSNNKLRENIKNKILNSSKGGNPGQWSARKAQLLAKEYKSSGGKYKSKPTKPQKSLNKWTKEKWTTKSGKPSLVTGERYLPKAAINNMSSQAYSATTKAKRLGMKENKQFVNQTPKAKLISKNYR